VVEVDGRRVDIGPGEFCCFPEASFIQSSRLVHLFARSCSELRRSMTSSEPRSDPRQKCFDTAMSRCGMTCVTRHNAFVRPSVVLWDFGDTLVDERWMRRCPESFPTWEMSWIAVMNELADQWNVGDVSFVEVSAALADAAAMTVPEVEAHARACCAQLTFHVNAWELARQRRWPQAIVTVNPDLFADFIVPVHGLSETFDQIVMSFAEQTDNKVALCDIALERLGYGGARDRAVLVDNRLELVDAWRDSGGAGYWFQSDDQFRRDAPLDDD
jgi:hypothetical protein